ncbi:uncharacterized protein At4g22758-like [Rutidosis leptorrhynchoides]|uniref:uncharacterized protein At4g22758-like n=1 Tax=Rutidosis leptorrhynchoides TaxID=125765 RepID=UPI003A9A5305
MSEKLLRRRFPISHRIKPPHPSHNHSTHRKTVTKRSSNIKSYSKLIKRCNSEPTLLAAGISIAGDEHHRLTPPSDSSCLMFQNRIAANVFSSSPELFPNSPDKISKGYNKDAKVVVKVMVEGSVGPVRAMVKLGSSVDQTIQIVMNKYNAEGRSPKLDQDAMTSFELHHSNFSLQCLDRSYMIGEIGSRSFYMRKSGNNNDEDVCSNASIDSKIAKIGQEDISSLSSDSFFHSSVYHNNLNKLIKCTSSIWRFLGCFDG